METAAAFDALGPRELLDVQLVLRGDLTEVTSELRARQVTGAVTGGDGWVAVQLAATVDPEPLAVALASAIGPPVLVGCTDVDDDVLNLLLLVDERPEPTTLFCGQVAARQKVPPEVVSEFARRLAGAFGRSEREVELRRLLQSKAHREAGEQWVALGDLLGLPARVAGAEPTSAIVLSRADRPTVRLAGALAGPAWLVPLEDTWSALFPKQGSSTTRADALRLAAGLSGAAGRRRPVLMLWKDEDEGSGCGYVLLRRGHAVDAHLWNSRWEILGDDQDFVDEFAGLPGDAKRLAAAFDRSDDVVALRALQRRSGDPGRLFDELAGLLGLPAPALDLFRDGLVPGELPDAEFVERTSPWRTVRDQVPAAPEPSRHPVLRGAYRLYAWLTVLAALVCALMTIGCTVEMFDDGAFGEPGGRVGDAGWVAAFAVLTVVLVFTARWRFRRLRG